MGDNRIRMPSSMGGLTRYFEDYKSKITFKPGHIIVLAILVIIIMIILHTQGYAMLGLG